MKTRVAAIFSSASLLLGGCATTGPVAPTYQISQDSTCLTKITDENGNLLIDDKGDLSLKFDEACAKHELEKLRIERETKAEQIRLTVWSTRQAALWELIVIGAKEEIKDPARGNVYSRLLLQGLRTHPNIREIALQAGVSDGELEKAIKDRNSRHCIIQNDVFICGQR